MEKKVKLSLLASGMLGKVALELLHKKYGLVSVFTDSKSTEIIEYAEGNGILLFVGNPRNGSAKSFLESHEVDVLFSVNYLFLVEPDLISWPKRYAINIHGSLLPKYRGRTPHVWAIINNEIETGATAHLITEGCDEGDLVLQEKITVDREDTGATLLEKFFSLYPEMLEKLYALIASGQLKPKPQNNSKATYFGKRTPDDGEINWNWQRERIYNWVRAQANPYPGAFTWLLGKKVIIDKVAFDDYGFSAENTNGEILTSEPLRVKTPNGVLAIESVREVLDISGLKTKKLRFENR